jgi:autotransporter-associated beta strand protein
VTATALNGGNATSSVRFDGGTLRITGTDTASNTLTLLAGGGTIDVATAGTTLTVDSAISGSGGLTKAGAGTLVLTNAGNAFAGGVTVARGALDVASDSPLGGAAGVVTVRSLGTLNYTASATTVSGRTYDLTTGTLRTSSGTTLTFNNATVGGGFLSGEFATQAGTTNTFAGTTTLPSAAVTAAGTNTFQNVTHGGQLTASSGSTNALIGFYNQPAGRITVGSGATVTVQDFQSSGQVAVTGTGLVTRTGASPITLGGGSITTVGVYNPVNGQVTFGGTINVGTGGTIVVQGGFLRNNGTITGGAGSTLIVDYGGVVKGIGEIDVASLVLRNGGQLQIGNSPGIIRIPNAGFNGSDSGVGAPVQGDLNNATGTVGGFPAAANGNTANSGWGAIEYGNSANTSGFLQLQRTVAGPVYWRYRTTVNDGIGNTPGAPANFSVTTGYTWTIFRPRTNSNDTGVPASGAGDQVNTVATVTLLDASGATLPNTDANLNQVLAFERSQFLNPATNLPVTPAEGTFSFAFAPDFVGRPNTVIQLVFTPVPEPATVLGLVALVGAGVTGWRRWVR